VLTRYRDTRIIVEMKMNSPALANAVVGDVRAADAIDRVCLGSFGRRVLRAARRMEPAIATSAAREEVRWALYRSWCRWPVSRVGYGGYHDMRIVSTPPLRAVMASSHKTVQPHGNPGLAADVFYTRPVRVERRQSPIHATLLHPCFLSPHFRRIQS